MNFSTKFMTCLFAILLPISAWPIQPSDQLSPSCRSKVDDRLRFYSSVTEEAELLTRLAQTTEHQVFRTPAVTQADINSVFTPEDEARLAEAFQRYADLFQENEFPSLRLKEEARDQIWAILTEFTQRVRHLTTLQEQKAARTIERMRTVIQTQPEIPTDMQRCPRDSDSWYKCYYQPKPNSLVMYVRETVFHGVPSILLTAPSLSIPLFTYDQWSLRVKEDGSFYGERNSLDDLRKSGEFPKIRDLFYVTPSQIDNHDFNLVGEELVIRQRFFRGFANETPLRGPLLPFVGHVFGCSPAEIAILRNERIHHPIEFNRQGQLSLKRPPNSSARRALPSQRRAAVRAASTRTP